jgi:hypothetical protein
MNRAGVEPRMKRKTFYFLMFLNLAGIWDQRQEILGNSLKVIRLWSMANQKESG